MNNYKLLSGAVIFGVLGAVAVCSPYLACYPERHHTTLNLTNEISGTTTIKSVVLTPKDASADLPNVLEPSIKDLRRAELSTKMVQMAKKVTGETGHNIQLQKVLFATKHVSDDSDAAVVVFSNEGSTLAIMFIFTESRWQTVSEQFE